MKTFRILACVLLCAIAVSAQSNNLLGESGTKCLLNQFKSPDALQSDDDRLLMAIAFQQCWTESEFIRTCPGGNLNHCAYANHAKIVTERYSIQYALYTLDDQDNKRIANIVIGLNRPEKWQSCIENETPENSASGGSNQALAQSLVMQRVGFATCDAIFGLMDLSVVYGFRLFEKARQ